MRLPQTGFIHRDWPHFWAPRDCGVLAEEWRGCEDGGAKSDRGDALHAAVARREWKLRKMRWKRERTERPAGAKGSRRYMTQPPRNATLWNCGDTRCACGCGDDDGKTPADMATARGHKEVVERLRKETG